MNDGYDCPVKPFGFSCRSHTTFILGTVVIALFSENVLYGIVVPVLPFLLQDRVGISRNHLQGYASALLAVHSGSSMVCSIFAGAIADRTKSRKAPFLVGLVISIIVGFALVSALKLRVH